MIRSYIYVYIATTEEKLSIMYLPLLVLLSPDGGQDNPCDSTGYISQLYQGHVE